jgi:acyl-CoA dehydrogenase
MVNLIEMTDEQAMLLETASEFCRDQSPIDKVRDGIDAAEPIDPALWRQIVDLGWLGIIVPAECGGLGLGLGDVVPISEQMGRCLMGTPFFTTVVTTQAIVSSASDAQRSEWLPGIAGGQVATIALTEQDGSWRLDDIASAAKPENGTVVLSGK